MCRLEWPLQGTEVMLVTWMEQLYSTLTRTMTWSDTLSELFCSSSFWSHYVRSQDTLVLFTGIVPLIHLILIVSLGPAMDIFLITVGNLEHLSFLQVYFLESGYSWFFFVSVVYGVILCRVLNPFSYIVSSVTVQENS